MPLAFGGVQEVILDLAQQMKLRVHQTGVATSQKNGRCWVYGMKFLCLGI